MRGQRGVALLLVLWVLALLSMLLAGLAGWVQLESRQALWQRQHTQALLAAEAGVNLAVAGITDPARQREWLADGRVHDLQFDGVALRVSARSEVGHLDANVASAADFTRLLVACGADPAAARTAARGLEVRRNGGQAPVRVVEELRQLPGMRAAVYSCMAPNMTLWSGLERPDPGFATPLLKRVLSLPTVAAVSDEGGPIVTLISTARLPQGQAATLRVTLLLNPSTDGARPYRVLHWQEE
ncbi:type II secretion system minor pseudopilin GspK [Pseudomonas sp. nanlin1]|uniref:type II secretion system minor pseudopilin GspK n=1 Tax=Pseudomonas sp. nanlin1 TaxID=3040605 RepID=UPI0038901659